jgi:hypothetical protein
VPSKAGSARSGASRQSQSGPSDGDTGLVPRQGRVVSYQHLTSTSLEGAAPGLDRDRLRGDPVRAKSILRCRPTGHSRGDGPPWAAHRRERSADSGSITVRWGASTDGGTIPSLSSEGSSPFTEEIGGAISMGPTSLQGGWRLDERMPLGGFDSLAELYDQFGSVVFGVAVRVAAAGRVWGPGATSALSDAIALCAAWEGGDMTVWATLARSVLDEDPVAILGQLSHVAVVLAQAVAATTTTQTGDPYTVLQVLQRLALEAEGEEEGEEVQSAASPRETCKP